MTRAGNRQPLRDSFHHANNKNLHNFKNIHKPDYSTFRHTKKDSLLYENCLLGEDYLSSLVDCFKGVATFSNLPPAFSIAAIADFEAA